MSYFGLNPVNQNQQLDQAASNPVGSPKNDVGFFDGSVSGAISTPSTSANFHNVPKLNV